MNADVRLSSRVQFLTYSEHSYIVTITPAAQLFAHLLAVAETTQLSGCLSSCSEFSRLACRQSSTDYSFLKLLNTGLFSLAVARSGHSEWRHCLLQSALFHSGEFLSPLLCMSLTLSNLVLPNPETFKINLRHRKEKEGPESTVNWEVVMEIDCPSKILQFQRIGSEVQLPNPLLVTLPPSFS